MAETKRSFHKLAGDQFVKAVDWLRDPQRQERLRQERPTLPMVAAAASLELGFPITPGQLAGVRKAIGFNWKPRQSPTRREEALESDTLVRKSYGELLYVLYYFRNALLDLHYKLGLPVDSELMAAATLAERRWECYLKAAAAGKAPYPLPDLQPLPLSA